jgi:hypothetical protein
VCWCACLFELYFLKLLNHTVFKLLNTFGDKSIFALTLEVKIDHGNILLLSSILLEEVVLQLGELFFRLLFLVHNGSRTS